MSMPMNLGRKATTLPCMEFMIALLELSKAEKSLVQYRVELINCHKNH